MDICIRVIFQVAPKLQRFPFEFQIYADNSGFRLDRVVHNVCNSIYKLITDVSQGPDQPFGTRNQFNWHWISVTH